MASNTRTLGLTSPVKDSPTLSRNSAATMASSLNFLLHMHPKVMFVQKDLSKNLGPVLDFHYSLPNFLITCGLKRSTALTGYEIFFLLPVLAMKYQLEVRKTRQELSTNHFLNLVHQDFLVSTTVIPQKVR